MLRWHFGNCCSEQQMHKMFIQLHRLTPVWWNRTVLTQNLVKSLLLTFSPQKVYFYLLSPLSLCSFSVSLFLSFSTLISAFLCPCFLSTRKILGEYLFISSHICLLDIVHIYSALIFLFSNPVLFCCHLFKCKLNIQISPSTVLCFLLQLLLKSSFQISLLFFKFFFSTS